MQATPKHAKSDVHNQNNSNVHFLTSLPCILAPRLFHTILSTSVKSCHRVHFKSQSIHKMMYCGALDILQHLVHKDSTNQTTLGTHNTTISVNQLCVPRGPVVVDSSGSRCHDAVQPDAVLLLLLRLLFPLAHASNT